MKTYKIHPFATAFPYMSDEEVKALSEDIKTNGQIHPIIVMGDVLLDGRHRLRACQMAEIEPAVKEYEGDVSDEALLKYITSLNIHRRHLTTSQKAFAGMKMMVALSAGAKERQRLAGGNHGNQYTKMAVVPMLEQPANEDTNQPEKSVVPILGQAGREEESSDNIEDSSTPAPMEKGRAIELAAKAVGVSKQYIHDAKKIEESHPQKAREVEEGKKTLPQALKEIKKEKEEQKQGGDEGEKKKEPPRLHVTVPKKGCGLQEFIKLASEIDNDESLPEEVPVVFVPGKALGYELSGERA